ncbi:O-methyltransferase [Aspergillus vadensis CBS 113365]|uniref:O-methyltransferase n=1 Tax=Aspergillus vadensis (strain CBS 113365 / IMI 142717 / IBT 24658) TaxID=1448311 RepID=A0A319CJM6_ASPVC|nr:O-methyltransferase [Aspergillus vadensis CBS 113365]PYH68482.1 O-methyltransferase [Aspergillus vadensis CBS 113365]
MDAENRVRATVDISVASSPSNLHEALKLLNEIAEDVKRLGTDSDDIRKDAIFKCRQLFLALSTPREIMADHCWGHIGAMMAVGFGVDSGLWILMAQNGDKPQRVADLASRLQIEPNLLSRLMRHLSAMGLLNEVGEDEYQPTNYTKALSLPQIGNGYLGLTACTSAGCLKFHEFSRKRGWTNPTNPEDTSLMNAYGTDKDLFTWVNELGYGKHLNDYLSGYNLGRRWWIHPDVYPVKERLINGADPSLDSPFLVDIGGNVGHDLERFRAAFPDVPGKLILQDLPMMIGQIKDLHSSIVRMEYDFHDEQPVKGARAYYIHSTLHNWCDDVCETLLKRVKEAMKPGYSRLLINEFVVPETGAHWETTGLDMMMLGLFSSEQRTRAAWFDLIERRVGLKIVHIWSAGAGVESVIECELTD